MMEVRKMPLVITEEMMKQDPFFEMGLKEGEKRGIEKGKEIGQRLLIERLIKKGMSIEEISALLDIPVEKLKELLKDK
jgi:predicted transposase/invertase (TIGR01784 family)